MVCQVRATPAARPLCAPPRARSAGGTARARRNFFGQRQTMQNLPVEERLIPKYQEGYPLDMAVYLTEAPTFSLRRCGLAFGQAWSAR